MTEKQLDNLKVGDVLYSYEYSQWGSVPMREYKNTITKISPKRKSFTIERNSGYWYNNKLNENEIRSYNLEPEEEIRKRMIKNKENIKHIENMFKEFSLLELNDFNNVYDIKAVMKQVINEKRLNERDNKLSKK